MSRIHRGRKALEKQLHEFAGERNLLPDDPDEPATAADTAVHIDESEQVAPAGEAVSP